MNKRVFIALAWVVLLLGGFSIQGGGMIKGQAADSSVLARVELGAEWPDLPLFAVLQDPSGADYALVVAPLARLEESGTSFRVLDQNVRAGDYVIALERRPGARSLAWQDFPVVFDDGRQIVVRLPTSDEDALSGYGFDIQRIGDQPIVLGAPARRFDLESFVPDPEISAMVSQVDQATVFDRTAQLSGFVPAVIGGAPYTVATRHTKSGEPIAKASQLVLERMQARGLKVELHRWTGRGLSSCSVIGEMSGTRLPSEIVLVVAHLDDQPRTGPAPGADDNASGAVAVWTAMDILSRHRFQRTLRFAFFSGEEQGLYGSAAYAADAAGRGGIRRLQHHPAGRFGARQCQHGRVHVLAHHRRDAGRCARGRAAR